MDLNSIIVGFVGVDKYEYFMYLSRVLYHMGKKVLLVDRSETKVLSSCIPYPRGLEDEMIEYRGVYVTSNTDLNQRTEEYDCILIDYGFTYEKSELGKCHHLVYVTDMQLHNMKRIRQIDHIPDIHKILIMKDVFQNKIVSQGIADQLGLLNLDKKRVYTIFFDEIDMRCRMSSQYDNIYHFHKLSAEVKKMIKQMILYFYPTIAKQVVDAAFKKAGKGE